jgi:hypothetical protein
VKLGNGKIVNFFGEVFFVDKKGNKYCGQKRLAEEKTFLPTQDHPQKRLVGG